MAPPDIVPRLVGLGAPVVCFDTCTVLDLMRDPTRDTVRPHERRSAMKLLTAIETGHELIAVAAEQVRLEFDEHADDVQKEASDALRKLLERIARIDDIVAVYGATGTAKLDHLNGHVTAARAIVDRWMRAAITAPQADAIAARAFSRVNHARAPARRGKDSMKDCVVIETYLDVIAELRAAGLKSKIVFASSNTKDYAQESGAAAKHGLQEDLDRLGIDYAPNLGAAAHLLGF